jgi:hypothetical protein
MAAMAFDKITGCQGHLAALTAVLSLHGIPENFHGISRTCQKLPQALETVETVEIHKEFQRIQNLEKQ